MGVSAAISHFIASILCKRGDALVRNPSYDISGNEVLGKDEITKKAAENLDLRSIIWLLAVTMNLVRKNSDCLRKPVLTS